MIDVIKGQIKSAQINKVLGLFIFYFGMVIIGATFFTTTFVGQMTNLIAGIVLLSIGLGMILKARQTLKNLQKDT